MAAAARYQRILSGENLVLAGLSLYVLVIVVLPLARLLLEGLAPGEEGQLLGLARDTWGGRSVGRALTNTIVISTLSTAVSVAVGVALALCVRLTDMWGRKAIVFLAMLPMLIPPQISALAWIELLGPSSVILQFAGLAPPPGTTNPLYSMGGIVWVMGLEHAPLVFLAVTAAASGLSNDLVEAARIGGAGAWRIVRSVILPLLAPSVVAGAALAYVSAIGNFGVPALLGIPGRVTVLTTLIYQRLNGFGPSVLGEVAAIAYLLIGLAVLGILVRIVFETRSRTAQARVGPPIRSFSLGRYRVAASALVWFATLFLSILPLVALASRALVPALGVKLSLETISLENFAFVLFESAAIRRAFANSFALASAAAILPALAAIPLAYFSTVCRAPLARLLDAAADAPYAVPGTVLAIGIILVFLPPLPFLGFSLYGTIWILLIAYLARFLLLALRPVGAAFSTLETGLDEAAAIAGARPMRRLAAIGTPLVAPAAVAGAMLIFMTAFNELTLSALLWSTGNETLGVMVFFLQYEGNSPAAAALATVVVAVTLALALLCDIFGRRYAPAAVPWHIAASVPDLSPRRSGVE
ncbi:ABC transporter permease [Pelagibacterium xiamenense]|uniref:ABC transporter permease n=1 Tax=Pelagibacterium xiamenense TaxID=2901140 RepID=UPI001E33ECDF|nr:iron ABC transporter permease [Pelagibacterium xiamenense]MCD7059792.1 iron ABC transporter permease [Pelagibacterium xiamenense]